jgi:FKBP-type peptidyl-prolyl cis-trans isomerase (trigger factor)
MAESISVNLRSVVGRVSGTNASNASGAGDSSTIEGLKKKLVSLQKDLKNAISEQSKEGQAKAKLIQMQIQMTQARIEQLIQQQAQRAAQKQIKSETSNLSSSDQINIVKKAGNAVLGGSIDVVV